MGLSRMVGAPAVSGPQTKPNHFGPPGKASPISIPRPIIAGSRGDHMLSPRRIDLLPAAKTPRCNTFENLIPHHESGVWKGIPLPRNLTKMPGPKPTASSELLWSAPCPISAESM